MEFFKNLDSFAVINGVSIIMFMIIVPLIICLYDARKALSMKIDINKHLMEHIQAQNKLIDAYQNSEKSYERMIKLNKGASRLFDIWLTCEKKFCISAEVNLFFLITSHVLTRYKEDNQVVTEGETETTTRFLGEEVSMKLPNGKFVDIDSISVQVSPAHMVDVVFIDKNGAIHPFTAFSSTDLYKLYILLSSQDEKTDLTYGE